MAKKFLTGFFYSSIALAGTLAFFVFLYWGLRRDSNLASFAANTAGEPLYFWSYVLLTAATGILFGTNLSLLTWRVRAFGFPRFRRGAGEVASGGIGALVGFAASACPVCGSTLLATVGIAGGLAAFPFSGLELKALSLTLIAASIGLLIGERRTLQKECAEGTCPVAPPLADGIGACPVAPPLADGIGACPAPKDASFQEKDGQTLATAILLVVILALFGWNMLKTDPILAGIATPHTASSTVSDPLIREIIGKVLPEKGFRSRIAFRDSVQKLIEYGAIDPAKFESLYIGRSGGMPAELRQLLERPSYNPVLLTADTAPYYLNLLWPLGLANRMEINNRSLLNGPDLFRFASTGGWVLGKEENGGAYFNKFEIVPLSSDEEALVKRIAENSYRPCCDNSTFFQDCNHGSALLGLLELGASQGLSEDELWREALAFNSFWFPETYVKTALYFKAVKGVEWQDVDPKLVMGRDYSSASGWYVNVERALQQAGIGFQLQQSGGCGV